MVMYGKVNKNLVPIVQVCFEDDVGEWKDIRLAHLTPDLTERLCSSHHSWMSITCQLGLTAN